MQGSGPAIAYSFVRLELVRTILPWSLLLIASVMGMTVLGRWIARRCPRLPRLRDGQIGTAEIEFTLAFPVFLSMVLLTIQLALLLNASLVVDYAAFCAARSASVWIPQDLEDEPANEIGPRADVPSDKRARIERAAKLALTPIAPRASTLARSVLGSIPFANEGELGRLLEGSLASGVGAAGYAKLAVDLVDKWFYADQFTEVSVLRESGEESNSFEESEPVTVVVTHSFHMGVPFGGAILGRAFGDRLPFPLTGFYVPVTARYSMQAWGAHEAR